MGHDPQRLAAAYLGGELSRHRRERVEAHLLECEACWGEVQAARRGRALAESVREV
ncbi:MAG TPA: zf-HC2 domain-containing protein, partial [Actinomycetota bacterium]|nr:zf-HC2 domain-containing protein [Actinomycetota bacterium]